jgi:hypothetical protein
MTTWDKQNTTLIRVTSWMWQGFKVDISRNFKNVILSKSDSNVWRENLDKRLAPNSERTYRNREATLTAAPLFAGTVRHHQRRPPTSGTRIYFYWFI